MLTFLSAMLLSTQFFSTPVSAQDLTKQNARKKGYQIIDDQRAIREVERGWYAKSNIGGSFIFAYFRSVHQTRYNHIYGWWKRYHRQREYVWSWEAGLISSIHNGNYQEQAALGCVVWELVYKVTLEHFSMVSENIPTYPNARFGIGVRGGGGGIMSIPLLMDELIIKKKIVPSFGAIIVHQGVKPVGMGGLHF